MSAYGNLQPGSIVPLSGQYKCQFCGKGGIADVLGKQTGFKHLNDAAKLPDVSMFFEADGRFADCPNCGKAAGWTLFEPQKITAGRVILTAGMKSSEVIRLLGQPSGGISESEIRAQASRVVIVGDPSQRRAETQYWLYEGKCRLVIRNGIVLKGESWGEPQTSDQSAPSAKTGQQSKKWWQFWK